MFSSFLYLPFFSCFIFLFFTSDTFSNFLPFPTKLHDKLCMQHTLSLQLASQKGIAKKIAGEVKYAFADEIVSKLVTYQSKLQEQLPLN